MCLYINQIYNIVIISEEKYRFLIEFYGKVILNLGWGVEVIKNAIKTTL